MEGPTIQPPPIPTTTTDISSSVPDNVFESGTVYAPSTSEADTVASVSDISFQEASDVSGVDTTKDDEVPAIPEELDEQGAAISPIISSGETLDVSSSELRSEQPIKPEEDVDPESNIIADIPEGKEGEEEALERQTQNTITAAREKLRKAIELEEEAKEREEKAKELDIQSATLLRESEQKMESALEKSNKEGTVVPSLQEPQDNETTVNLVKNDDLYASVLSVMPQDKPTLEDFISLYRSAIVEKDFVMLFLGDSPFKGKRVVGLTDVANMTGELSTQVNDFLQGVKDNLQSSCSAIKKETPVQESKSQPSQSVEPVQVSQESKVSTSPQIVREPTSNPNSIPNVTPAASPITNQTSSSSTTTGESGQRLDGKTLDELKAMRVDMTKQKKELRNELLQLKRAKKGDSDEFRKATEKLTKLDKEHKTISSLIKSKLDKSRRTAKRSGSSSNQSGGKLTRRRRK